MRLKNDMIYFLMISTSSTKRGAIEIYPKFIIKKSSDLMIRGGDFYAIWIEERGLWSTDEQDALQLIDRELDRYAEESRQRFDSGLSYRTILGNDVDSDDYGYKLHLVYGCLASPSEKGYQTKNDSPEPIALSWEFSTTPAEISKLIEGKRIKPTAILTFDSTRVNAKNLAELEEILYGKDPTSPEGDDGVEPRLPLPDEVIEIMSKENP